MVDDIGNPISNVHANVYNIFDMDTKPGLTDTNGMHTTRLDKIFHISGSFKKHGYYTSYGDFWKAPEWGKVPPANTNFTIVLKRILEPVPMRQREVTVIFPRLNEPIGFDLEVGDWIFPDGKGKTVDMFLTAERKYVSRREYSFSVSAEFIGELNGIQSFIKPSTHDLKSELPPPPIAPKFGYMKTFESFSRHLSPDKWASASFVENRNWIFRIRTEIDKDRNIVSANYGWIVKDPASIPIPQPDGTGSFTIIYYYNPDPKSRSLEPKEIADRQAKDIPKEGGK